MQCSTEELVIEDVEERLKIKRLYWTMKKICESNLPATNGSGLVPLSREVPSSSGRPYLKSLMEPSAGSLAKYNCFA